MTAPTFSPSRWAYAVNPPMSLNSRARTLTPHSSKSSTMLRIGLRPRSRQSARSKDTVTTSRRVSFKPAPRRLPVGGLEAERAFGVHDDGAGSGGGLLGVPHLSGWAGQFSARWSQWVISLVSRSLTSASVLAIRLRRAERISWRCSGTTWAPWRALRGPCRRGLPPRPARARAWCRSEPAHAHDGDQGIGQDAAYGGGGLQILQLHTDDDNVPPRVRTRRLVASLVRESQPAGDVSASVFIVFHVTG